MKFRYLSFLSSDEKVDNEKIDNEKIDNEKIDNEEIDNEEVDNEALILNDEVRIASEDDEADMEKNKGNEEIIKLSVRLRRSGKKRKATRKSLNYHAKMRKGR
jgi:hypothetical protein